MLNRNRLYILLFLLCGVAFAWLFYHFNQAHEPSSGEVCLIKKTTGVPCPSCGTTRSVLAMGRGEFYHALLLNPLGYLTAFILLISPIWIVRDWWVKSQSLWKFYIRVENTLKRPIIFIPLALALLANWIWNISKGL